MCIRLMTKRELQTFQTLKEVKEKTEAEVEALCDIEQSPDLFRLISVAPISDAAM